MSFKGSIEAIKKIEKETAMKDRGGVAYFVDGDQGRLAFFGEKEMVERAIFTIVTTMTDGMTQMKPDGTKISPIISLEADIIEEYLPRMRKAKKENGEKVLLVRDEVSDTDNFEKVAEYIARNAVPVKDTDYFLFAMVHKDKIISSGINLICNKHTASRMTSGSLSDFNQLAGKILSALMGLLVNYLAMYTPCTKASIKDFFERLRRTKQHLGKGRMFRSFEYSPVYPPVSGPIQ